MIQNKGTQSEVVSLAGLRYVLGSSDLPGPVCSRSNETVRTFTQYVTKHVLQCLEMSRSRFWGRKLEEENENVSYERLNVSFGALGPLIWLSSAQ